MGCQSIAWLLLGFHNITVVPIGLKKPSKWLLLGFHNITVVPIGLKKPSKKYQRWLSSPVIMRTGYDSAAVVPK